MRDTARAETLLALFTSAECAAAIAGDLTEERQRRGLGWFWLHVAGTMVVLWRNGVTDAPLAILALAAAGCGLFAAPALGGAAAVGLFPQLIGSAVTWLPLSLCWWGGALWTGATLIGISPKRGMAACAMLALLGEALLIAFALSPLSHGWLSGPLVVFYVSSFTALRSFLERTQGAAGPEAHLRARYVANADGSVARPWTPPPPVLQTMSRAIQDAFKTYNPERIRVPALAIYAVPQFVNGLMRPWYNRDDPAILDGVQRLHQLARERFARHAKWFEAFADRGRATELSGAHHLFLSNPSEVLQQIDAFMSRL